MVPRSGERTRGLCRPCARELDPGRHQRMGHIRPGHGRRVRRLRRLGADGRSRALLRGD